MLNGGLRIEGHQARQAALRRKSGYRPPVKKPPTPTRNYKVWTTDDELIANDPSPPELKAVFVEGTNLLKDLGFHPTATFGMMKGMVRGHVIKPKTILEVTEAIGVNSAATFNFWRFVAVGRVDLAGESIIIKYPQYFSEQAIRVAKKRIAMIGTPGGLTKLELARYQINSKGFRKV